MKLDNYSIYQVREQGEAKKFLFEPLEGLHRKGFSVERGNYDLVYAGLLGPVGDPVDLTLEVLFKNLNVEQPLDYTARSLSVSDVVVLRLGSVVSAHYVDSAGFAEVLEFLHGPYVYYATQRPVDIGTFPKIPGGPERIENFDRRIPVEDGAFEAWGLVTYSDPLTPEQIREFELRAAIDNPDRWRIPPRQLQARVQIVGRWERERNLPEFQRMTTQGKELDTFLLKPGVGFLQFTIRYDQTYMNF